MLSDILGSAVLLLLLFNLDLLLQHLRDLFTNAFLLLELLLLKLVVFRLAMLVDLVLASKADATWLALEFSNNCAFLDWLDIVFLIKIFVLLVSILVCIFRVLLQIFDGVFEALLKHFPVFLQL